MADNAGAALSKRLAEKGREIAAAYAIATGRDMASMSGAEKAAFDEEVCNLIEEAEEGFVDGDTPEEWTAHDERLAASPLSRVILERHEIEQQLLDHLDETNSWIR
jgi:hypothetical protein